jgi:glycosyltransferase involved in cell wall biosynthesis
MSRKYELSIVAPVYNEEANIDFLFNRLSDTLKGLNYEILFVNDGSADGSITKIKDLAAQHTHIKYISFSRNFGHQIAVFAGLQKAVGDYVVIIDADLQDPPELIHEMLTKAKSGYEVVYAKRLSRKGESFFKKLTARMFYRMMRAMTSINIPLDTGDFRIMTQRVCKIVTSMPEKNKFLRGQISWIGFNQSYVEYERDPRLYGETGYTFKKMLNFAIDGITAFSQFPIRLVTYIGLSMGALSMLALVYALYSKFIIGEVVKGWTSIFILFTLIGGTQLFCLGIIGEYISRIMNNVLNRPDYLVEDTNIEN